MGKATYHPVKKRFVVKAVRDGMSLKTASEKYGVPLHTIYGWTGKLNRTSPKMTGSLPKKVKTSHKNVRTQEVFLLSGIEEENPENSIVNSTVEPPASTLDQVAAMNADDNIPIESDLCAPVLPKKTAAAPDYPGRRRRRTFTTKDKLRILAEADRAVGPGAIGALLHREGLYSSALTHWRRQRAAGKFGNLMPSESVPKSNTGNRLAAELAKLQKDNAQLQSRLQRSEAIINLLQQLSDLLSRSKLQANDRNMSSSNINES